MLSKHLEIKLKLALSIFESFKNHLVASVKYSIKIYLIYNT